MSNNSDVRMPTVAGQFYDDDPIALKANIQSFLGKGSLVHTVPENSIVRSVIVPHAGYMFSGAVAARSISTALAGNYKRIVVLAPSHYCLLSGLAIPAYKKYRTPFGDMVVDNESIEKLTETSRNNPSSMFSENNQPHVREHALEVQLPLLQFFFPELPIVPLVCGEINVENAAVIASNLSHLWTDESLWVVSSDFTHYGSSFNYVPFFNNIPDELSKLDNGAIDQILELNSAGFSNYIQKTGATICGRNPIMLMMCAGQQALERGENLGTKLIEYTTSGELTGDYSNTVSYAGITVFS